MRGLGWLCVGFRINICSHRLNWLDQSGLPNCVHSEHNEQCNQMMKYHDK